MIIAIDFDGTCVSHDFPKVGKDIGAVSTLKELVENGHQLILFTMRSDGDAGSYLTDAISWFADNGIDLHGINTNPAQKSWTSSPKAYAQLYIDDAALGCPVDFNAELSDRPYVDWKAVREILKESNLIK